MAIVGYEWLLAIAALAAIILLVVRRRRTGRTTVAAPSPPTFLTCSQCGRALPRGAVFCDGCGARVEPTPQAPRVATLLGKKYCQNCAGVVDEPTVYCPTCGGMQFAVRPPARIGRPTGVTIVGILQIIFGVVTFLAYVTIGGVIGSLLTLGGAQGLGTGIFALAVIFGILPLFFGVAVFTGREWARILMLIAGVLNVLAWIASFLLYVPALVLGLVILWYLTRPRVVAYFKQPR